MQFHRRARKKDEEERILPLINVVFLLLIFFMLAGRLATSEPFRIALPESAAADETQRRDAVLLLAADGRLALDGQALEPAELKTALAARLADVPDLSVNLKADGAAEATAVVAVMETLRDAGLRDLRLLALPSRSAQP